MVVKAGGDWLVDTGMRWGLGSVGRDVGCMEGSLGWGLGVG